MSYWEVIKVICNIPLGVAAICGSLIAGMAAFIMASLLCYSFWTMIFESKNESIWARGWEDDDDSGI